MKLLLNDEFGASGATVASANARGYDMTAQNLAAADEHDTQLEQDFASRKFPVHAAPALHWDNAKKTDWLYTALLYIGACTSGQVFRCGTAWPSSLFSPVLLCSSSRPTAWLAGAKFTADVVPP